MFRCQHWVIAVRVKLRKIIATFTVTIPTVAIPTEHSSAIGVYPSVRLFMWQDCHTASIRALLLADWLRRALLLAASIGRRGRVSNSRRVVNSRVSVVVFSRVLGQMVVWSSKSLNCIGLVNDEVVEEVKLCVAYSLIDWLSVWLQRCMCCCLVEGIITYWESGKLLLVFDSTCHSWQLPSHPS